MIQNLHAKFWKKIPLFLLKVKNIFTMMKTKLNYFLIWVIVTCSQIQV